MTTVSWSSHETTPRWFVRPVKRARTTSTTRDSAWLAVSSVWTCTPCATGSNSGDFVTWTGMTRELTTGDSLLRDAGRYIEGSVLSHHGPPLGYCDSRRRLARGNGVAGSARN